MSTDKIEDNLELLGDGEAFRGELCSMIERTQMFKDFSRADIEHLARYARAYTVAKGKTIFREGQKAAFLCVIVDGVVDVIKKTDAHEPKKINSIRAGRSFGEMAVLDDMPHSATTVAADAVKLVMITKQKLEQLAIDNPTLGVKVLWELAKLMSLRLRQTTGSLVDHL
jgi:CRP/FNR family transcriptional regulator, cyclic AMP receptor protein